MHACLRSQPSPPLEGLDVFGLLRFMLSPVGNPSAFGTGHKGGIRHSFVLNLAALVEQVRLGQTLRYPGPTLPVSTAAVSPGLAWTSQDGKQGKISRRGPHAPSRTVFAAYHFLPLFLLESVGVYRGKMSLVQSFCFKSLL